MTSDQIRERYLAFFEERGHLRVPSASLVPPPSDRSVLLTTAGMQPFMPYFRGEEAPPQSRLASCQKCFRAVDIDNVGNTTRHLTLFEMLGNFSFDDYFKREAIDFAWELSRDVFGLEGQDIWVTVFAGDQALGLGPDEEAIALWIDVGVPRERIIQCSRAENFWQAGPTGPCGPCSELYIDRGLEFGSKDDLPGGDNERFLEYWNLVFTQYEQDPPDHLTPLPANNIDTGLGLNRMAAILQGKHSVFETDQFLPLIELGQELSGRRYGEELVSDRALRILADHSRAMTFLLADGVVPSNEDRGYVLRRVMRRAIQQGLNLELEPGFLTRYAACVREIMGGAYPEVIEQAEAIDMWLSAEEETFGRTLAQGTALLEQEIEQAHSTERSTVPAEAVFVLYDTHGFPYEMTRELLAAEGLSVEGDFDALMEEQRERSRSVAARAGVRIGASAAGVGAIDDTPPTRFTGYETEEQRTTVVAVRPDEMADANGGDRSNRPRLLVKLEESPFYLAGGGQISDVGTIECERGDCRARVEDVVPLGQDRALRVVVEQGELEAGEPVLARVDHLTRHKTEANHTATHLLQAALRERIGAHVRQAGSYVGPDKLRFDFSHGHSLSAEELRDIEDRVNEWIARNDPVRPITTTLAEAKRLGAMALFGEKYKDVVRMVQVGEGEDSRELCGGTHVRSTAEIGAFRILSESSSAANVRRIEAVTGPAAVALLREHDYLLAEIAATLRTRPDEAPQLVAKRERERRELEKQSRSAGAGSADPGTVDIDALLGAVADIGGATVLASTVDVGDAGALLAIVDRLKGKLPDAAIVLGTAVDGRVHLIVSVAPALVERGLKAGAIVKSAAAVVGGGGGGRDTLAQAGGREPAKLGEAIETAQEAIATTLQS
jgi:alanyl-tRNA synthetase